MALPALALLPILGSIGTALRIPALATYIAGLAATMVAFFVTWFSKRVAINLTIITLVFGLTVGIFTVIKASLAGISVVAPPYFLDAMNMITPNNFWPCASAIFSAKIIRWVWVWKVHFITMYSQG